MIKFLVDNIKFYGAIISLEAGYFFASPLAVNHNWKNGFLSLPPPLFHISSLGKFSFNSEMPTFSPVTASSKLLYSSRVGMNSQILL